MSLNNNLHPLPFRVVVGDCCPVSRGWIDLLFGLSKANGSVFPEQDGVANAAPLGTFSLSHISGKGEPIGR